MSIIVPVYNESLERLRAQMLSFRRQTLDPASYEIVYVVNNGLPDGTPESAHVQKQNDAALTYLNSVKGLTLHVIDRSSKGLAIPDCNVGKARNIGIAETSIRYFENGVDGILFQTDADTRLQNKDHLRKILSAFRANPRAFGAAGGVRYELDPDTNGSVDRARYFRYSNLVKLYFKWQTLLYERHVSNPRPPVTPTRFSGMHMISRAVASACVGGVIERNYAEDTQFGQDLRAFATRHKGIILGKRDEWYVTSAFRESFRTDASYGSVLTKIIQDGEVYVDAEDAPYYIHFRRQMLNKIRKAPSIDACRVLIQDDQTPFFVSDSELKGLKKALDGAKDDEEELKQFAKWKKTFPRNVDVVKRLYHQKYPPVKLTAYRLQRLKKQLHTDPIKLAHYENVMHNWQNIRIVRTRV